MNSRETVKQINQLTIKLVELGLCDEQNYPSVSEKGRENCTITFAGLPNLSVALKNIPYEQIYFELDSTKSFNFKLLDGALIQLQYEFLNNELHSHRLAYFPAPSFEAFQNEPQLYLEDEIYAEVMHKNTVAFPIRFDFNASDEIHIDNQHPKSHVTLGQYKNCRIPVFSALTPVIFIKFILKHFYNTTFRRYEEELELESGMFSCSLSKTEKASPHFTTGVPY